MFKSRFSSEVPQIDTTSTADISFMLLIFFLVTSSMDTDKGLTRQLPPPDDSTREVRDVEVKERNVLAVEIASDGTILCGGEAITAEGLTQRVEEFVENKGNSPTLPEKSQREVHLLGLCSVSDRHVITLQASPDVTYDSYFLVQDAIVRGYNHLRSQFAHSAFGHPLAQCSTEERAAVAMVYPQRISERIE